MARENEADQLTRDLRVLDLLTHARVEIEHAIVGGDVAVAKGLLIPLRDLLGGGSVCVDI